MSPLHLSNLQDASLGSFLFLSVTITSNHSVELPQMLCKRRAKKEDFTTLAAGYRPKPMMCSCFKWRGNVGQPVLKQRNYFHPSKKKKNQEENVYLSRSVYHHWFLCSKLPIAPTRICPHMSLLPTLGEEKMKSQHKE